MQVLAQLRLGGDGINELMAGVLGVAGHKADVVARMLECRETLITLASITMITE